MERKVDHKKDNAGMAAGVGAGRFELSNQGEKYSYADFIRKGLNGKDGIVGPGAKNLGEGAFKGTSAKGRKA